MPPNRQRKPRVFIGSAGEHLELAHAVQDNLGRAVEATVWDQKVFRSGLTLEALLQRLQHSDFGVFVVAPIDRTTSRQRRHSAPRDNVILELGMFLGHLGQHRTFLIVPRDRKDLKLPSDLDGLIMMEYDASRLDGNLQAALGPACQQILHVVLEESANAERAASGLVSSGLFVETYVKRFNAMIDATQELTLLFIHSMRWRENHVNSLGAFYKRKETKLTVFLPDTRVEGLTSTISEHFADENNVPSKVRDAYEYFANVMATMPGRVNVWLFPRYPVYTLYGFDDRLVIALYPNARTKRDVPTFEILRDSVFGRFLSGDIECLREESSECSGEDLKALAKIQV